jgi:hypothetical protein
VFSTLPKEVLDALLIPISGSRLSLALGTTSSSCSNTVASDRCDDAKLSKMRAALRPFAKHLEATELAAYRDAGQNKPLYLDHPQLEGFEVWQTVRRGETVVA